jgi:hypothetical protein
MVTLKTSRFGPAMVAVWNRDRRGLAARLELWLASGVMRSKIFAVMVWRLLGDSNQLHLIFSPMACFPMRVRSRQAQPGSHVISNIIFTKISIGSFPKCSRIPGVEYTMARLTR